MKEKQDFMREALKCAKKAWSHDDVPVGAVVIRNGTIIARGENRVQYKRNPTYHAEMVAIRRATKKLGKKFLENCDMYVTLEPCAMCATAISYARMRRIIFAALDEKGGAVLHNVKIFENDPHLWKPEILHAPEYSEESANMLKEFFKIKRAKKIKGL
jgi:tRNA(adenine34) deaminase